MKPDQKDWEHKTACLTTFLSASAMLIGLKLNVIFSSCISKLICGEFTFFQRYQVTSIISFLHLCFHFSWKPVTAENMSLLVLPGLHMQRNIWQQSLMEILREREVLKQLKKILAQP